MIACGAPGPYNASKEWADKKVVLIAVPGKLRTVLDQGLRLSSSCLEISLKTVRANGNVFLGAFTPSCSETHLPGFIENIDKIKAKGVDLVAVIAYNDPFVMSAWGKAYKVKGDIVRRAKRSLNSITDSCRIRLVIHDGS